MHTQNMLCLIAAMCKSVTSDDDSNGGMCGSK